MDAESTKECTCELCRPNWHLGHDDEFVIVSLAPVQDCELVARHVLKLREAGLTLNLEPQPA